jgi:hypothetical protein
MFTDSTLQKIEQALGKALPGEDHTLAERTDYICEEIKRLYARKMSPDEEVLTWFVDWMNREGLRVYRRDDSTGRWSIAHEYHGSSGNLQNLVDRFLTWYDERILERRKARRSLRNVLEAVKEVAGMKGPSVANILRKRGFEFEADRLEQLTQAFEKYTG